MVGHVSKSFSFSTNYIYLTYSVVPVDHASRIREVYLFYKLHILDVQCGASGSRVTYLTYSVVPVDHASRIREVYLFYKLHILDVQCGASGSRVTYPRGIYYIYIYFLYTNYLTLQRSVAYVSRRLESYIYFFLTSYLTYSKVLVDHAPRLLVVYLFFKLLSLQRGIGLCVTAPRGLSFHDTRRLCRHQLFIYSNYRTSLISVSVCKCMIIYLCMR